MGFLFEVLFEEFLDLRSVGQQGVEFVRCEHQRIVASLPAYQDTLGFGQLKRDFHSSGFKPCFLRIWLPMLTGSVWSTPLLGSYHSMKHSGQILDVPCHIEPRTRSTSRLQASQTGGRQHSHKASDTGSVITHP